MDRKQFPIQENKGQLFEISLLDYTTYTSSNLIDSTWHSPSLHSNTDNSTLTNGHSHHPMTNGYNSSTKSRSCENNLDSCGRKVSDEFATSSSSLIDLPTSPDYDNLENVNDHHLSMTNNEILVINPPMTRLILPNQSPIFCELDRKVKDEIDARLKDIDDEYESNCKNFFDEEFSQKNFVSLSAPVTAETVNKSVDLPSVRRLAKRLYTLDGFQSIDVARHLCKRYSMVNPSSPMTCEIFSSTSSFVFLVAQLLI